MPKHILITNDDGIESGFLHAIAHALSGRFRITIAAPKGQQSWIGRAVSRSRTVSVEPHPELPWPAWTIDGTPTDCVNIALGSLLPERPDAIVSGINIGYNTTATLIYSSGTVAGALEGAFWGLPAFAVSQEVPDHLFGEVAENNGRLPADWEPLLAANARHAADFIASEIDSNNGKPAKSFPHDAIVHNLNYPASPREPYETVRTVPATLHEMPFFRTNGNGGYNFHFQHGKNRPSEAKTDRDAIAAGEVSHSILNFSALGRDLNH